MGKDKVFRGIIPPMPIKVVYGKTIRPPNGKVRGRKPLPAEMTADVILGKD